MSKPLLEKPAYLQPAAAVLQQLRVRTELGLSSAEAARRAKQFGVNDIPHRNEHRVLKLFLQRFKDVLVLILLAAGGVSLLLGRTADAFIIAIAVALDTGLSFIQVWRTERTLERLRAQVPDTITVLRNGTAQTIPSAQLVLGDIIELRSGEKVPADARLIKLNGLRAQESLLTGESADISKNTAALATRTAVSNRQNMVFTGTSIVSGSGWAVVTAIGTGTEFGKIAQMLRSQASPPSPLRVKLQRQGMYVGWVIIAAVALLTVIGLLQGQSFTETGRTAITLIVSAIPEDLTMILTIALTVGVVRILRHKGVVRELSSGETLGAATVICTDKTGTLTQGKMSVTGLNFLQGDTLLPGSPAPQEPFQHLALLGFAIATSAHRKQGSKEYFGSATERTALAFAEEAGLDQEALREKWRLRDAIDFDSKWKYRAVLVDHPTQSTRFIFTTGAPEVLLERSSATLSEDSAVVALDAKRRFDIQQKINALAEQGHRLLAVAVQRNFKAAEITHDDIDQLTFLGVLTIQDPVREDVRAAIAETISAGVQVKVVTGDLEATARAVARQVGLTAPADASITGDLLQQMSDKELALAIDKLVIFARVEPLDKQRIIRALRQKGHVVAMTGDGINDAIALKAADIGVAMGSGSDIARDAADLILLDNSFSTIVHAIREGRVIRDNVRKVIAFLLSTNAAEVVIFFASILLGLPLPLLPAQILWINLVTDGTSDIALSLEPAERQAMRRKPEDPKQSLIDRWLWSHITFSGVVLTVATMTLYWYLLRTLEQPLPYARTMAFTFLSVASLSSVWSFRSLSESIRRRGFLQNRYVLLSTTASLLLHMAAIYVPALRSFFSTVPLGVLDWVVVISLAVITTVVLDMRKFVLPYRPAVAPAAGGKPALLTSA